MSSKVNESLFEEIVSWFAASQNVYTIVFVNTEPELFYLGLWIILLMSFNFEITLSISRSASKRDSWKVFVFVAQENIVKQMHASIMFVIIYRSGFVNKTLTFEPVSKRAPHVAMRRLCNY